MCLPSSQGLDRQEIRNKIPHVFDFVRLAVLHQQANDSNTADIPEVLLCSRAVDTAITIGNGASFNAARLTVPRFPNREFESWLGGLRVISSVRVVVPRYLVYKTARVAFQQSGEPVSHHEGSALSAFTEMLVLGYSPLCKHPNIVQCLGLAWGSNPFEPSHKLPAIIVEYAEHGTLEDLLHREVLDSDTKLSLVLDIAQGIDSLHHSGLIHGDIKTENVLIFPDGQRRYLAKVADFGFSIVGLEDDALIQIGGTRPWTAPEANRPLAKRLLSFTDTFSFGLLVWKVLIDGLNPFVLLLERVDDREIDRLKGTDELLRRSRLMTWFPTWLPTYLQTHGVQHDQTLLTTEFAQSIANGDSFFGMIDAITERTLRKEPESRSLAEVINLLRTSTGRPPV